MHPSDNGSNSKKTGTYTSDGIFIPDRIATPSELSRATTQTAPAPKTVDISSNFTGEENSGYGANGAVVKRVNPEYEIDPATGKKFYPLPIFKIIPRENRTVIRQINNEWEIDPATGKKFYPLPIYGTFTGEENAYTPDAGQSAPDESQPMTPSRLNAIADKAASQRQAITSTFTGEENPITAEGLKTPLSALQAQNQDSSVQPPMTPSRLSAMTLDTGAKQQTDTPYIFTTGEEFPIAGAQTVQDAQATLDNIGKWLYDGEARDYLLNNIKKIGSMGLAGLEAAQGIAEDSAAGVEQIGSDVLNGLAGTAGAVGNGIGNAVNYTAQGLTQAFSTIASPIAESLSNSGEVSAATDILLDIARSLEYLGTGSMSDFEAISDIQVSNLMEKLRNMRILGFPLPEGMSRRLSEVEDALLNFSITKSWEQSIEDRYHPNEQEKHAGKFLQEFSAGLYPYILDFLGIEGHPFNEDSGLDPDTAPENPEEGEDWLSTEGAGDGLKMSDKQFGKKVGKHAEDFGLDPSSSESRDFVRNTANEIFRKPTEIREGVFRGQGVVLPNGANATGKVRFYIQGNDVVITDMSNNFITIMKDGINNLYVKKAMRIWP